MPSDEEYTWYLRGVDERGSGGLQVPKINTNFPRAIACCDADEANAAVEVWGERQKGEGEGWEEAAQAAVGAGRPQVFP